VLVYQGSAAAEQRVQRPAKVFARERFLDHLDAVLLRFLGAAIIRGDDGDAFGCDADVPQHERQSALPDAAEADEDDPAGKLNVYLVIGHDAPESSEARNSRA